MGCSETRTRARTHTKSPERPRISRATRNRPRERMTSSKEKSRKFADISENLREKCTHAHYESLSSWEKSMLIELCFCNKMNVSEMTTSKINSNSSSVIKMNNQTIRELRAIAKERGLRGYFKLRKAELVSLLEETPVRPPRRPYWSLQ